MKIKSIKIKNFRSIIGEQKFDLCNYSLIVGENNSGKTNVLDSILIFFGEKKFKKKVDFPRIKGFDDNEDSFIKIIFCLNNKEWKNLPNKYKKNVEEKELPLIKYFHNPPSNLKKKKIYHTKNQEKQFSDASSIIEGKIGRGLVYIPEEPDVKDGIKTSGPSPLRKLLNNLIKDVAEEEYKKLEKKFSDFSRNIKKEEGKRGWSVENVEENINDEMKSWNSKVNIDFETPKLKDIVKRSTDLTFEEKYISGKLNIDNLGEGIKRRIIFSVFKTYSKFNLLGVKSSKKDFDPNLRIFIIEEPESCLHPLRRKEMYLALKKILKNSNTQILITTHSPIFVGKKSDNLRSIIKLNKNEGHTSINQIESKEKLDKKNNELFKKCKKIYDNPSQLGDGNYNNENVKNYLKGNGLVKKDDKVESKLKREKFKYFLSLNPNRAFIFFSKHILICEGRTEKVLFDYLLENKWNEEFDLKNIYILDAGGKHEFHRFINLFEELGIKYSYLFDRDLHNGGNSHSDEIQEMINNNIDNLAEEGDYCEGYDSFKKDLPDFLDYKEGVFNNQKPATGLIALEDGEIKEEKLEELKDILIDELNLPIL